ncbi:hypothetical protein VPH35_073068 [Triticum aestivum]
MQSHEHIHLSLRNYRAGRRRLDLPLPAISGDTADTHRIPSTPSTIYPHLFDPPPPKSPPPSNPSAVCIGSDGFTTGRSSNGISLPTNSSCRAARTRRATMAVRRDHLNRCGSGNMAATDARLAFVYCY